MGAVLLESSSSVLNVLIWPTPEPTYRPRSLDPALSARVNTAWTRIERWLGTHASATLRKLEHPVDLGHITRWEKDGKFPDDLYASLLRHDGAEGNFGAGFQIPPSVGLARLSSFGSLSHYNCMDLVLAGSVKDADPDDGTWHGSLIPFGADGRGHDMFVDPRTGRVGDKKSTGPLDYSQGWPSFAAMLEAVATSLENGEPLRGRYPSVTTGCELRWTEDEPGTLPTNCAGPPRPAPTPTPSPQDLLIPDAEPLTPAQAAELGCTPSRKPPVTKYPSKKVQAAWQRIERWLARKAPKTLRTLGPPAAAAAVARAEKAMNNTFPDDLRASLLRHDGARDWGFTFPPFFGPASLKRIQGEWKLMCGLFIDGSVELDDDWWHGWLIPFAPSHDGGHLYVDTDGTVGEHFNEDGLRPGKYPSYLALLKQTARALEKGRTSDGWIPKVVKGELDWDFRR